VFNIRKGGLAIHGREVFYEFISKFPEFIFIYEGMSIGGTYYQPTFL